MRAATGSTVCKAATECLWVAQLSNSCSSQLEDGSLNWGLIVFMGLLLAVVPLWCHVIRAAAKLSPCYRRRSQEQLLVSASQPLLGKAFLQPLAPEKPMAERACPIEVRLCSIILGAAERYFWCVALLAWAVLCVYIGQLW